MPYIVQVIDKVKEESATKAGEQADWKRCLAHLTAAFCACCALMLAEAVHDSF